MHAADLKHPNRALQQKLHALYTLNRHAKINLSFRPPYLDLLAAFGNPHLSLPPVIHVAGTNGKGSIIAILRSILEASGYKVHAYTSPHLLRFNERIVLAGEPIQDTPLEALIDEALALNDGRDCTFFEITTALAFAAFSRIPADILLLETGLGGRLDCTNIIEKPLVSVINKISYDHMQYLGSSLSKIAAEKAGIIKRKTPCIIGMQSDEAVAEGVTNVFEQKAQELSAPLYRAGQEWNAAGYDSQMRFTFNGQESLLPPPNLRGLHQIDNAGAALAALKVIEKSHPIPEDARRYGLTKIRWDARLERLDAQSFEAEGWEIWLDGGHNDSAGLALAQQAALWRQKDGKMLHLIVGMKADKDAEAFLRPLLPFAADLSLVAIGGVGGCLKASEIKLLLDKSGKMPFFEAANVRKAIHALVRNNAAQSPARILVCGSLYLAEQVY